MGQQQTAASARDIQAPARRPRVIIADDDRDSVLILAALLREDGYDTKAVYRGNEVLNAVSEFGADVALIDIAMPGATGYEVAREMRRSYGHAAPTLIAVTAWNKPSDKVLAQLAGFDHHIGKPYDPNRLLDLIRRSLDDPRNRVNTASRPAPAMTLAGGGTADTLHSRLLQRLSLLLGGTEALRRALMVPTVSLSRWLAGAEQMPTAVFLKATDLLVDAHKVAEGTWTPGPARCEDPDATIPDA